MVTFINESSETLESIFNEFDMLIVEACNKCEYATLVSQYNYVCENGVMMPIYEAEEKKENLLKKLINALVTGLTNLKDKLVKWCRSHYEGSKLQAVVNKIKVKFTKGKRSVESASTPDEAKAASKEASEDMKEEAKTSDFKIPKKYQKMSFRSFDMDNFWRAIEGKDFDDLKINTVSVIRNDPTFARNEFKNIMSIFDAMVPEIFENEVHLDYEERLDREDWTKRYFTLLTCWLKDNFAKSRIPYIKEVGRVVHKDFEKQYQESLKIGTKKWQREQRRKQRDGNIHQ